MIMIDLDCDRQASTFNIEMYLGRRADSWR